MTDGLSATPSIWPTRGEEVPTRLPTGTVLAGDLGSLNAVTIESDRTRYLSSLTEDMEYITTKKANNRVIKSA